MGVTGDGAVDAEVAVVRGHVGADREIGFEGEGWDSRVYLVDGGEYVFKFPRSEDVRATYRSEIEVLQRVEGLGLPLWTPRVRWVGPDDTYFGYVGMLGVAADLGRANETQRTAIGRAIGSFACALHRMDLPGVRRMEVEDEIRAFQRQWAAAAPMAAAHLSPAERSRLDRFFTEMMPAEMRRLGCELVLCHGDLGPWNIVVGSDDTIGVIDFGDVAWCDRSKDLVGMYETVALDAALDAYEYAGDVETLRARIAVRARAVPAMDLVFFSGKRDAERLDLCFDRIRNLHA